MDERGPLRTLLLVLAASVFFLGARALLFRDTPLPPLGSMARMDEGEVNRLLSGRPIEELEEKWGAPDSLRDDGRIWVWEMGEYALAVAADPEGEVVACGLWPAQG